MSFPTGEPPASPHKPHVGFKGSKGSKRQIWGMAKQMRGVVRLPPISARHPPDFPQDICRAIREDAGGAEAESTRSPKAK
jgi:hypothetical protein